MADESATAEEAAGKKGKGGLLIGLVLALLAGGGGFAFTSGMLKGGSSGGSAKPALLSEDLAFLPVEPMTVAIGPSSDRRYLRFRAELEVDEDYRSDIQAMMPRVVDVLQTYLQSLEMEDIENPSSLLTLRSQMRRRVDLVVGGNRLHDLLVMEFVVN